MTTLNLFDDGAPDYVPPSSHGTIQERFEEFHRLNPWVYEAIEKLAADWIGRGRKRLGIGMLWEVLRWQYAMRTQDVSSEFKLNDHYRSRYVRLLLRKHPEWTEVFELRALKSA
jgi:hypothetical protein